jgi:hypothetical protein
MNRYSRCLTESKHRKYKLNSLWDGIAGGEAKILSIVFEICIITPLALKIYFINPIPHKQMAWTLA